MKSPDQVNIELEIKRQTLTLLKQVNGIVAITVLSAGCYAIYAVVKLFLG